MGVASDNPTTTVWAPGVSTPLTRAEGARARGAAGQTPGTSVGLPPRRAWAAADPGNPAVRVSVATASATKLLRERTGLMVSLPVLGVDGAWCSWAMIASS